MPIPTPKPPRDPVTRQLVQRHREVLTGLTGTVVTLTRHAVDTTEQVFKNGLLLIPATNYTLSGTTLTLAAALLSTDTLIVWYHSRP